jgi:hypothetical protein
MMKFNLVFWVFSIALQGILLAILITRGIFRRVPFFTSLIAFYILRAIVLYIVSSNLLGPSRMLVFSGLAVVDIILQTAVAWELFSAIVNSSPANPSPNAARRENSQAPSFDMARLRKLATFSLLLIAASSFAFVGSTLIHANPRALIDRGVLFSSSLFIGVFLTSLARNTPPQIHRLIQGFALYATASIVCQICRTIAGAQRNGAAFNRWTYIESAAYVVVILFWIIALSKESPDYKASAA